MATQRAQMKEVLDWLVRGACRAGTRDFCSARLTAHCTLFQFRPHRPASWAGSRAGLPVTERN